MPERRDDGGGGELQDTATSAAAAPAAGRPRGADRPRWEIFLGLAAVVLVLDQLAKAWILANVDPARPLGLLGDFVRLVLSRNTGALFGLFRDNATLFALVSVVVIGAIAWFHGRSPRSAVLSTALGLLLGGAIGNLVDRIRLGYVVDFVDAGIGGLRWYTFNVADAAISTALLLLVLLALRPSLGGDTPSAEPVASARREPGPGG